MYLEDSFIRRYYNISTIFLAFAFVEGVLYWLSLVTFVNFVYLLFELIWLFYSLVLFAYIIIEKRPKGTLALPLWYLLYFVAGFIYTLMYEWSRSAQGALDKDIFVRNNAVILLAFSVLGFAVYWVVRRKFFRKLF